ncbi:MAG: hypothetical protein ABII27_02550 [bacterium]
MDKVYFALTVDIDPDNFDSSIFGSHNINSWRGADQCIANFKEKLSTLKDSQDLSPKITWFVRVDSELQQRYGSYTYLLERYKNEWEHFEANRDEIAWHPHEIDIKKLDASYKALMAVRTNITAVRIGNAFHSNEFMKSLSSKGFLVDSTALPGRTRNDSERGFNWVSTPAYPYHPSIDDYRIPLGDNLPILEVPMTMLNTRASYDTNILQRYCNLAYNHEIIRDSLTSKIQTNNLIIAIVHPSEMLNHDKPHPLISFSTETVVRNISFLLEQAKQAKKEVVYTTITNIYNLFKASIIANETIKK